jgi:hypothetical protein
VGAYDGGVSSVLAAGTGNRSVHWLIWLGAAALLSVLAGFAVGLARPRVKAG